MIRPPWYPPQVFKRGRDQWLFNMGADAMLKAVIERLEILREVMENHLIDDILAQLKREIMETGILYEQEAFGEG